MAALPLVLACDDVSADYSVDVAVAKKFRALSVLCVGRVRGDLSVAEQDRAQIDLRVTSRWHWRAVECHPVPKTVQRCFMKAVCFFFARCDRHGGPVVSNHASVCDHLLPARLDAMKKGVSLGVQNK